MTDVAQWYALAFGAGIAALVLRKLLMLFNSFVTPRLHRLLLRHITYPLLIERRRWPAVTRSHAVLISLYLAANIAALFLFSNGTIEIQARSAMLAVVNIAPLPFVGHVNTLSDCLGLSTAAHSLGHRTIGTAAMLHAFVHTGFALASQPRFGYTTYSGLVASGALLGILILSIIGLFARVRRWAHELLGFTVLGGVLWHFSLLSPPSIVTRIALAVSLGSCLFSGLVRVFRAWFFSTKATVTDIYLDDSGASRFVVSTKRPMRILPGKYLYVLMTGSFWFSFHSYPLMAVPSSPGSAQGNSELMFCVTDASKSIRGLKIGQKLWLDGPYGPGLRLETCENLVLVARGIGILGILPIALHIASRKQQDARKSKPAVELHMLEVELKEAEDERSKLEQNGRPVDQARLTRLRDKITGLRKALHVKGATRELFFRDLTRRITILWVPDHNSQARWVGKQIQLLQELDPVRVSTFQAASLDTHC
ncbi:hypothetical protein F5B18DRAFT_655790 [Nemania serpens]|nr:hypothetical protein F5B18DRAFT_655790 [Nemania serpens]